ncbi:hypothetical protein [Streptomyces xantholiticus]|uniref:hypothetical protein n=1 Tax=Streptomyces xantholiticus TaxID=68285 RepID=UPI0016729A46|nr:hypothetical protein [Streptomyces xantholiticus]GGW72346.1 hypothetical protein GCM10010381_66340 [Streptomyces xantholiticus]
MIGHALPDLARAWGHNRGLRNTCSVSPASDARPSDLAARQQLHGSAEYRHHVLDDTFEEERRQARTVRLPENLFTLHDLAFQAVKADRFGNIACSRCHYTSPPTSS